MRFEVAEHSLKSLCLLVVDCPHATPKWTSAGVVVLRNQNIKGGRLDLSSPSFTDEGHYQGRVRRAVPQAGDIVITREAPMGDVCQIPRGLRCCLGQRQVLLRPDPTKVDGRFLLFALQSPYLQHQIAWNEGTGSTVSNLRIPILEALRVPTPTLPVQIEIAETLGALDDRIALLRETNATLEAIAQALFKSWFVDFDPVRAKRQGLAPAGMDEATAALFPDSFEESALGLVPKGWDVRALDEIASYLNGLALQKYPPSDDAWLPVIKIAQLRKGDTIGADRAGRNLRPEYIIQNGDVLFSWSGSLEVDVWCGGEGALNQHLFKVTSQEFPKWFYLHWTRHHLDHFRQIAASKATTMGHIQRAHLSEAKVLVPSDDLLRAMTAFFVPILQRSIDNELQAQTLATLRDTLLPRLISGQLRLPEALEKVGTV
jgi:type I restriction enzyme S subunit